MPSTGAPNRPSRGVPIDQPRVSVVIPTRNEELYLPTCLDSVLGALKLAGGGEILVADGDSTDRTLEIARVFAQRHRSIRVIRNPHRITPAGFNAGIRAARSQHVAIVSAHSKVDPSFFVAALRILERGDADIVGGPVLTLPAGPGVLAWLLAQVVSHPFGVGNSRFRISRTRQYVDAVPFAVFRREVFTVAGLFDERLPRNQDTDFFGRAARAGFRVLMDPEVSSTYVARGTFLGLLQQGFLNAFWNVRVWRQNPAAFRLRHAVPALFATAFWTLAALAPFSRVSVYAGVMLLGAYFTAAFCAAANIWVRTRRASTLALPVVFFVYHLAYGTGSLAGLRWLVAKIKPGSPSGGTTAALGAGR